MFNTISYGNPFRQPKQKTEESVDNELSIDSHENQNKRKLESQLGGRRHRIK